MYFFTRSSVNVNWACLTTGEFVTKNFLYFPKITGLCFEMSSLMAYTTNFILFIFYFFPKNKQNHPESELDVIIPYAKKKKLADKVNNSITHILLNWAKTHIAQPFYFIHFCVFAFYFFFLSFCPLYLVEDAQLKGRGVVLFSLNGPEEEIFIFISQWGRRKKKI